MINVSQEGEPSPSLLRTGLAFRPFFWLGSVFIVLALFAWSAFYSGNTLLDPMGSMLWWHQHEMIFGFGAAIVVGFLMTAVQNWTGIPSIKGKQLWGLAALWLLARLSIAFSLFPAIVTILIDIAFLPLVATAMATYVIKAKRWRNLIFIPVLSLLTLANLGMHVGNYTDNWNASLHSAYMAIWLIVTLIIVVGGRVIPLFTANTMRFQVRPMRKRLEQVLIASALAVCLLQGLRALGAPVTPWLFAPFLLLVAIISLFRWLSWQPHKCLEQPMIWGLHASYFFVLMGAVLWMCAEFGKIRIDSALHTITVGGMMTIILTMMSRVSLGHSGRMIKALPGKSIALVALLTAGFIRGIGLLIWPSAAITLYQISMALGIGAFTWFVIHYTYPLWSPRADNRPG